MKQEEFAIAVSEKEQEDAIREVSLKIKAIFPKHIGHLIILFTPGYNPANILRNINFTLKPHKILGLSAPFLIFEGKIIQKGIIACCINKEPLESEEAFLKKGESRDLKEIMEASFKKIKRGDFFFLSFLSPPVDPSAYLRSTRMALGRILNLLGAGYINKYSASGYQIVNNFLCEGMISLALKGLKINPLKLGGYIPLGKQFTITKANASRGIIREINREPAVNIYKHYLEEKFETFIKNHLFSFYPLGIKNNGKIQLVNVLDALEDGSLLCLGEIRDGSCGNIMFLDSGILSEEIEKKLKTVKTKEAGLVFIINSLARKRILRETADKEVRSIKQALGNRSRVIGLYSDYYLFPDEERGEINIETSDILVSFWQ
jgi:hypothetical protein